MNKNKKISKKVILTLITLVVAFFIYLVVFALFVENNYKSYKITGPGMYPTLISGETIKTDRHFSSVKIGDIVVFNNPQGAGILVKRVVALGGEGIAINNNVVTVYKNDNLKNGFDPDTSYLPTGTKTSGNIDITVPRGDVYVLGDNRSDSVDSRIFGPIPTSSIIGVETSVIK